MRYNRYMPTEKTILLAEDDSDLRSLYKTILESGGFTVRVAHDGEEALTMATDQHPDLLILDVNMPKKDGITVMKQIRVTDWGQKIPIIIFTAEDSSDARLEDIVKWEPTFFLIKGVVKPDDLIEKAQEALKNRGS